MNDTRMNMDILLTASMAHSERVPADILNYMTLKNFVKDKDNRI